MTTQTESPEVVATQRKRPNRGRRSTTGFRITLPLVYAGMGVALGTLTGMTMALITVPVDASVVTDAAPSSAVVASTNNSQVVVTAPAKDAPQPAVVRVAEDVKSTSENATASAVSNSPADAPTTNNQEKAIPSPKLQNTPSKAPAAEANPNTQVLPAESLPRRHVAHPVIMPVRTVMASTPEVVEVSLDNEQLSMVDEVKSPTFYSEGDLTVADYNPTAGTIETSDGRTFVLGTTVSASSATSWDDYRSSVHYRCDQEGSCMLMRAG
ncbi:MAG: hypothetical protein WB573_22680, partial [Terracidiphilus sp.]